MGALLRFPLPQLEEEESAERENVKPMPVKKEEKVVKKVPKESVAINWHQTFVHLYKWTFGAIILSTILGAIIQLIALGKW